VAISCTWQYEALKVELGPDADDHTDIVYSINWRYIADDGEGHNAQAFGTVSVKPWEEGEPWIPYPDIQESDVEHWTQEALGEDELAEITARLDAQIAEQATPTHETHYTMPWDEDGG
jgi:hypothetical protein